MKKKKYNCPAEMTLALFSGKWQVIVLWLLRRGPQRSGKIKSQLPGITAEAFSRAVRELEDAALIQRKIKGHYPLQVSYALTERGESLSPIVKNLVKWGLQNQSEYVLGDFGMISK